MGGWEKNHDAYVMITGAGTKRVTTNASRVSGIDYEGKMWGCAREQGGEEQYRLHWLLVQMP